MKKIYILLGAVLLSVSSFAQLQNLDFENWDSPIDDIGFTNRPTEWVWRHGSMSNPDGFFYHPPVTDAQSNDYALKLSVWYNHTKDGASQTATIDYRPARLKGYYKYTDNVITGPEGTVPDTAEVTVYLTVVQIWPMEIDTVGIGRVRLLNSEEYTMFEVDITYSSDVTPEFIEVHLDPSLVARYEDRHYSSLGEAVVSFFTVDNLSLEGEVAVGVDDINDTRSIGIYPNPVKNILQVTLDERQPISIYSTTGKLIEQYTAAAFHALDVSSYPSGIYIIKSNEGVTRFVKD